MPVGAIRKKERKVKKGKRQNGIKNKGGNKEMKKVIENRLTAGKK